MACCESFVKYILFFLNLVFWAAGGALLGLGIYLEVDKDVSHIVEVADIPIHVGSISLIILGCVMFVIGFCGCCGAIKEHRCLLGVYFTFVLLIFLTQMGVAIWGFVSQSSIESWIKTGLNNSIPITPNASDANAIINLQQTFKCCGLLKGCQDWQNGNASGCTCTPTATNNATCSTNYTDSDTCHNAQKPGQAMYSEDCYDAIYKFIKDNIVVIAGVAIGIAVAEIFVMIFAIVVCKAADKNKYTTV